MYLYIYYKMGYFQILHDFCVSKKCWEKYGKYVVYSFAYMFCLLQVLWYTKGMHDMDFFPSQ